MGSLVQKQMKSCGVDRKALDLEKIEHLATNDADLTNFAKPISGLNL